MESTKKEKMRRRKVKHSKTGHLITYFNSDSIISDQFRTIRTNIKFLPGKRSNRIFLITSPSEGEGKTTTAANLAVSMAQQKERILLVDANLRGSNIHNMFDIPNQFGLTDILAKKGTFEDIVHKTGIGKLDILPSGSTLLNPAELLGNELMTELLNVAITNYHTVLIDSPPILESTGTRVLANQCDGVVLVLNRGKTKVREAVEARKLLELAHAKLVGVIMNDK